MYLLLNQSNTPALGNTIVELISATGCVAFDADRRRAVIDGMPDTVSFSAEYSGDELMRELAKRALLVLLTRDYGCKLFIDYERRHG